MEAGGEGAKVASGAMELVSLFHIAGLAKLSSPVRESLFRISCEKGLPMGATAGADARLRAAYSEAKPARPCKRRPIRWTMLVAVAPSPAQIRVYRRWRLV